MDKTLSIVIPVYNESEAVAPVIEDVLQHFPGHQVILVNDGSTDQTAETLARFANRLTIVTLYRNRGYGGALKKGIEKATGDFVGIMDSDGQHRAEDLLALWRQYQHEDMIIGARSRESHFPLLRRPGKLLLKMIAEYLAGQRIPDLNSGMRIMRRSVIQDYFPILPTTFSFSTTSTVALMKDGYEVVFLPITARPRIGSSTVHMGHGVNTIILLLRLIMLFDPLKVFLPISLGNFGLFLLWAYYEYFWLALHRFGSTTIILFVSSMLFFILGLLADQLAMVRKLK